ncbi:metal-dependent hydrolase family protein [Dyella subtropica]|uniref:metal-dependent hydrolase family protein n=1 Tax=Dyella subtropica TaxID=2992127 RepID=UPI00224FA14D|nr:amidohydrolase family protein [Dyella subtropica]
MLVKLNTKYLGALLLALPLAQAPALAADTPDTSSPDTSVPLKALHCGHLIDVEQGRTLGETTVLVRGERIENVVHGQAAPADAQLIDLTHDTCLPGMIDSHAHLTYQISPSSFSDKIRRNLADFAIASTVYARRTLLAGFTTVRNLGDYGNESIALRNAVNTGTVPGPRIFAAGVPIGSTGGHADPTDGFRADLQGDPGPKDGIVNSPDDALKAIRQHYKDGVDVIKIMPSGGALDESRSADRAQMTLEEIKAIVATAHDYGFTVAAHAHGAEAIRRAVLGGVDSIEHGTYMNAEDMRLMKEHGTWFVPTLSPPDYLIGKAKTPGYFSPQVTEKILHMGNRNQQMARDAYRAGLKFAFGTDAGVYPHGDNAHEFELMASAGLPPMFCIQSATINAAQLLERERDLGSLAPGKYADIVAVPGDPIDNISLLRHIDFVMKGGAVYKSGGIATEPKAAP